MRSLIQFHELLWRDFAKRRRLPLARGEDGYYLNGKTKEAHAAWVERSSIEFSDGPKSYYNAALCAASTMVYELLLGQDKNEATRVAKAIQSMRIGYGKAEEEVKDDKRP